MALDRHRLEALQARSSDLAPLLDYLRASGYTLEGIGRLLALEDPTVLLASAARSAFLYGDELERQGTPLAVLAQLFLLGGRVDPAAYAAALPAPIRNLLEEHALVHVVDGRIAGQVTVVEYESLYFMSDKLFEHRGGGDVQVPAMADVVWPMSEWSLSLYRHLRRDALWQSFLDVGAGSGCLSLLVHRRHARTVGIDLNPRAVAFATLNAALNQAPDVRYEVADCFGYEDPSRHDHIVFAAPGGPGFDETGTRLVSHGGKLGHEIVLRFVSERVEHLMAPAGCCQVWGVFAVAEVDGTLERLLERALDLDRLRFTAEPLRRGGLHVSAEAIARNKLPWDCHYARGPHQAPFLEQLRQNRIVEVVPAVVTIEWRCPDLLSVPSSV